MALVPALSTNKALAKLTILSFTETKGGGIRPALLPPFIAMYNPTTFTLSSHKELLSKLNSDGLQGVLECKNEINRTLTVDLVLDATGASPAGGFIGAGLSKVAKALKGVDVLIAAFFATTTLPDPISHVPNHLKVIWGAGLFFECRLTDSTVTYSLFGRDGRPLRASIKAVFEEAPTKLSLAKIKNFFSSPDVTKEYVVLAGDTIYNIADRFYESESFYLQIAEANDLKNYRRLTPGMKLILPPVQKVEE